MDYLAVCAQVIKSRVRRTNKSGCPTPWEAKIHQSRSEKIIKVNTAVFLLFLFSDAWENVKAFQQIS